VQGELPFDERRKTMSAITLGTHHRDVVGRLVEQDVTDAEAFCWRGQVQSLFNYTCCGILLFLFPVFFRSNFHLISVGFPSYFRLISVLFPSYFRLISVLFQTDFHILPADCHGGPLLQCRHGALLRRRCCSRLISVFFLCLSGLISD
jgi:hypothetical protein